MEQWQHTIPELVGKPLANTTPIPGVEEVRAIGDRSDDQAQIFRWSDNGATSNTQAVRDDEEQRRWLPAIYCRHCGRSGWMAQMTPGEDVEERAEEEYCPSCVEADAIRYLGSSVATLLSVALSNLFDLDELDNSEKKPWCLRTRCRMRRTGPALSKTVHAPSTYVPVFTAALYELLPPDVINAPQFRGVWESGTLPVAVNASDEVLAWACGVVEKMRIEGGIYHPWPRIKQVARDLLVVSIVGKPSDLLPAKK